MKVYQSRARFSQNSVDSTNRGSSRVTLLCLSIPTTRQEMIVLHWRLQIKQPPSLDRHLELNVRSIHSPADKYRWNQSTYKGCSRRRSGTWKDRSRMLASQAVVIFGTAASHRRDRRDYDPTIEFRRRSMQSRKGAFYVAKELMEIHKNPLSSKKHKAVKVEPHSIRQLCMRNRMRVTFQCCSSHLIYRKQ